MTRITTATQAAAAAEAEGLDPNIVSKAEFARINGWSKSYVSKLGSEGRLVVTEDGKVLVAESQARIAATTTAPERASPSVVMVELQDLQAREKMLDVRRKQREEDVELGKLLVAADVVAAIAEAGTLFRQRLEGWPHRLAPQIAAMAGNEACIKGLLIDEVELLLTDVSQRLGKAAASPASPASTKS